MENERAQIKSETKFWRSNIQVTGEFQKEKTEEYRRGNYQQNNSS